MSALSLHPATRLLAWMSFALLTPKFDLTVLVLSSVLLLLWYITAGQPTACLRYIKRVRILLLVMVLLYAYTTPGEAIFNAWGAPSLEGLQAGGVQAWRLLLIVSSLSLAIASLPRSALVAAIYTLLSPLQALGLQRERWTARLWLTLHYAEHMTLKGGLSERWEQATAPASVQDQVIAFEAPAFSLRDGVFAVLCAITFGLALW